MGLEPTCASFGGKCCSIQLQRHFWFHARRAANLRFNLSRPAVYAGNGNLAGEEKLEF